MAKIPQTIKEAGAPLAKYLKLNGFQLINQGKVRDTWASPAQSFLLMIASDRISAFDFVLNALISKKGEVLTALTHFWLNGPLSIFPNHLMKSREMPGANTAYDLFKNSLPGLPVERCLVVENLGGKVYPFELIYRGYIGGSVYKKYLKTGKAGGHELPPNLPKWSKLNKAIFTPSTKEEVGHDINIDAKYYYEKMGEEGRETEEMVAHAYATAHDYAAAKGILILDTKFEVARRRIVDEVLTPDSSRFALKDDWERAMAEKRDPYFYDKQLVRDWLMGVETPFEITGINQLDPTNEEHLKFVGNLEIPEDIKAETTRRYLQIFEWLTGQTLESYQKEKMGV
ncbi:MAG: phosphoribosylaminoimidazolesuccinocarboxamide synthase [Patescibacteria group bacterium]|jgi:phosphoribosylaminoimidazole-succinocarboxamide synthase